MGKGNVIPLDALLRLLGNMATAASEENWDRVSLLHDECDAMVREEFGTGEATHGRLLAVRQAVETVRALTAAAREKTAGELERHGQNHRAVSAYLQSSGER